MNLLRSNLKKLKQGKRVQGPLLLKSLPKRKASMSMITIRKLLATKTQFNGLVAKRKKKRRNKLRRRKTMTTNKLKS